MNMLWPLTGWEAEMVSGLIPVLAWIVAMDWFSR